MNNDNEDNKELILINKVSTLPDVLIEIIKNYLPLVSSIF